MNRLLCIVGGMNAGGAETFLMKIYRALDKSKYQMDFLVAIEEKGFYDDEINFLGGKIFHVPPKSKVFLKNFKEISRIVEDNHYKSVLRVSQHSLSAMDLLAARLGGAKKIAFRSSNSSTVDESNKEVLLHKLCLFMPKIIPNIRFAPSTEAAEFMFGRNSVTNKKAQILHNALDLNIFFYDEKGRNQIRKEFGINDKTLLCGHIGRFKKQKNHSFLIKVFNSLHGINPNSKLLLVGNGELEPEIRSQIKDLKLENDVIFAGVRSDITQLLSAMDIFLFPSFYEGMPNTVIEAQATGLPCIISDTITREANITGLVHYMSLSDPLEQWADQAIKCILEKRIDTKSIFLKEKYDINSVVEEFTKLCY